ncbi:hypothetical protein [Halonatronum saccharophilum]|uniref:hypothetical protein n=1 Tax=Halonatronum saccharophilum TaxID=150060 RepID=UPI0012EB410C|nr:hypothetical protein [Halonatronum saccharophilum]
MFVIKVRVKGPTITGFIIAIITFIIYSLVTLIGDLEWTLIGFSNILFTEFLFLLLSASVLSVRKRAGFKFQREKSRKEEEKNPLELLIAGAPLLILSIIITMF